MDMSLPLEHKVLMERKCFAFFFLLNWTITILQDYCNFCKSIDHYVEIWKTYKTNEKKKQAKEKFEQRKLGKEAHRCLSKLSMVGKMQKNHMIWLILTRHILWKILSW